MAHKRPVNGRIGARLTEARKARGISQGWLAKRIGVSVGTIQAYERGRARITVERLEAIADVLRCEAGDLLGLVAPIAWLTF
jgi:transcriptional regulator with XRE-family HTH domain